VQCSAVQRSAAQCRAVKVPRRRRLFSEAQRRSASLSVSQPRQHAAPSRQLHHGHDDRHDRHVRHPPRVRRCACARIDWPGRAGLRRVPGVAAR
jgi:hypothetical protein